MNSAGSVPADWTALRDRWEFGHTVGFVLFTVSFVLMVLALVAGSQKELRAA